MENIVGKYKKIKLMDDLYLLKYDKSIKDVDYDGQFNTVYYKERGASVALQSMDSYPFYDSKEKYCFADFNERDDLTYYFDGIKHQNDNQDSEEIDEEELADELEEEIDEDVPDKDLCQMFDKSQSKVFTFALINRENKSVELIEIDDQDIRDAQLNPESFIDFSIFSINSSRCVMMPTEYLGQMQRFIDNGEYDKLKEVLNNIGNYFPKTDENEDEDEDMDDYGNVLSNDTDTAVIKSVHQNDNTTVDDVIDELHELVGLADVKKSVEKFKVFLQFINATKGKLNIDVPNLNMVFQGPSGTGKTTVAKLMAKILYKLGYTENDKFVETTSQDFIGGYVGQTAIKARKVLKENKGGVILIDEAYSFASKGQEFADEALAEILKSMEKKETIFILAGYTDEMKNFINMNSGLRSRIGYYIDYNNYSLDELMEILKKKIEKSHLKLALDAEDSLRNLINASMQSKNFGNGRFIDNLYDKLVVEHAYRVQGTEDLETLITIKSEDINNDLVNELRSKTKTKKIGF